MRRLLFSLWALIAAAPILAGPTDGLTAAQDKAKARQCGLNLKDVGIAIRLYNMTFETMPASLDELVTCQKTGLSEKQLRCPDCSDQPPDGKPLDPIFKSYALAVTPIPDAAPNPADLVIVYEKKARHGGTRNLLFHDGHVETVSEEKFLEIAKAQGFLRPPRPKREKRDLTQEEAAEVAQLMDRLGDRSFDVRETATRRLLEIGPAAAPVLRKGLESSDMEVRLRAGEILNAFDAEERDE